MMRMYFRIMLVLSLIFGFGILPAFSETPQLTISFHSESVVVGPEISLGEIGKIVINNEMLCKTLRDLIIAEAAPPGETREISLSYIKKCIKELGFNLQEIQFNGPKVLRITTMPNKLIDLLIEDQTAFQHEDSQEFLDAKSVKDCHFQVIVPGSSKTFVCCANENLFNGSLTNLRAAFQLVFT